MGKVKDCHRWRAGATGGWLSAELYNAVEGNLGCSFCTSIAENLKVTIVEAGPHAYCLLPEHVSTAAHQGSSLGVDVHYDLRR